MKKCEKDAQLSLVSFDTEKNLAADWLDRNTIKS